MIRTLFLAAGIALAMLGLLFLVQGTGVFPYPTRSTMIGQSAWAYRGVTMVTVGCTLAILSRSLGRRSPPRR